MQPPRVAHVIQGLGRGGAERLVIDLVESRRDKQLNASVVALYGGCSETTLESLHAAGVAIYQLNKARRPDPATLAKLALLLGRLRPDVVHCHTFSGLVYGYLAAVAVRIKNTVYTDHSSGIPQTGYGRLQGLVTHLESQVSAVVTFSDALKNQLVATRHLRASRVWVIPNGVSVPQSITREERDRLRASLGIAERDIFVLSVGGLRPEKNYGLLLRSLARVQHQMPDLPLKAWIVGDGEQRRELGDLIVSLQLRSTSLVGERDDARQLMRACDIFVNTSAWEGMPIAVLEAMAAGRPVVAPRVGALADVLSTAGALVDSEEIAIAGALTQLAVDSSVRDQLGSRARERVSSQFSIHQTIDRYEQLYESLVPVRS